jgi:hypothetical protein
LPPEPNEIGWKETVRVNPLEHCIVAMRPIAMPQLPFDLPNSVRAIDVTKPLGAILMGGPNGFVDPGGTNTTVVNHLVNFGWEYVWHCHILSHEEMDMMHALSLVVAPKVPTNLSGNLLSNPRRVVLNWTNPALNATGFVVERSTNNTFSTNLVSFNTAGVVTTYTDSTVAQGTTYYYRVKAVNVVGDTTVYTLPAVGYPTQTAVSLPSTPVTISGGVSTPAAPTNLIAVTPHTTNTPITLNWTDNANNETNFTVERSSNGGATWFSVSTNVPPNNTATPVTIIYVTSTGTVGTSYIFRVRARNASGNSAWSNNSNAVIR